MCLAKGKKFSRKVSRGLPCPGTSILAGLAYPLTASEAGKPPVALWRRYTQDERVACWKLMQTLLSLVLTLELSSE
jgi:hypothetical protein